MNEKLRGLLRKPLSHLAWHAGGGTVLTSYPDGAAGLSAVEHIGEPFDAIAEMLKLIDGSSRGLPDPARIPKDRDEIIDVTPTQVAPHPQALPAAKPPPKADIAECPAESARPSRHPSAQLRMSALCQKRLLSIGLNLSIWRRTNDGWPDKCSHLTVGHRLGAPRGRLGPSGNSYG